MRSNGSRSPAKLLMKDEARRIAANAAKLPVLTNLLPPLAELSSHTTGNVKDCL